MSELKSRELVYQLLYDCLEKGAFSNLVFDSDNNNAFVRAAVYGTLTYCFALDFVIKHITGKDVAKMDPATRTIIRFGSWQIICSDKVPSYAAVDTSVALARKYCKSSSGFINAILHKIADEDVDFTKFKPEVAVSLKPEIYGILKKSYGKEKALSIGKAFLESPRLTVRTNTTKTSVDELKDTLDDDGFDVSCDVSVPQALVIKPRDGISIADSLSFKRGEFFVQGEGAMIASILATPKHGDRILDCCSAPGGKSTHMAELASDDCEIISIDINASRVGLINENAQRLGLRSIKTMVGDSTNLQAILGEQVSSFDIVTADVPCSGLGLLGRKPDIRHSITYERMLELLPKQRKILDNASKFVKPGGVLIYSTCTLNRQENEEQLQAFLQMHDDFYAEDISDILPGKLIMDSNKAIDAKNGFITLFPDTDNCDGFFAARLRRRS